MAGQSSLSSDDRAMPGVWVSAPRGKAHPNEPGSNAVQRQEGPDRDCGRLAFCRS